MYEITMDSFDDDLFALSDDDIPSLAPKCNPVQEHLMKQLSDVRNRIEKTKSDIDEIQDTTKRVLKALNSRAQYGEVITSDSDSDLYTINGEPVIKKRKHKRHNRSQILIVRDSWKYIVCDKWIIGVVLQNTSMETVQDLKFYIDIKGENEVHGTSMFWFLEDNTFWCRTSTVAPRKDVVAIAVLDLPKFDQESFSDAYGTIAFEIDDKQCQAPVPTVRLLVQETIDGTCELKFSSDVKYDILAVKSVSFEKTIGIPLEADHERGARLLEFLQEKSFEEISADVYAVKAAGSLMYGLVEILPIIENEARLRISARSTNQMNIMLRLLRDQFSDMTIKEDNNCIKAAIALIEELELYLQNGSAPAIQRAKIKTDLLIP